MKKVSLDAGSGGRASQRLINDIFLSAFQNPILERMDDAALLTDLGAPLAMSSDSFVVTPLFFAGGSIGSLAINGTVNDVAMLGARPLYLTCSLIIEEGLSIETLERVVADMARACKKAGVKIVAGDTKVAPAGACDKLFINTTGIGRVYAEEPPSGHNAQADDAILLSGSLGDHAIAVMAARDDLDFLSNIESDCAPLADMIENVIKAAGPVRVLRDPTRGGLATTLNEIAEQSGVGVLIDEDKIPLRQEVIDGCSFLGLDPLYLANEGKCVCVLPSARAREALAVMRASPYGKDAAIIGRITANRPGKVILNTGIGGQRVLGMLEGAQLPRIC